MSDTTAQSPAAAPPTTATITIQLAERDGSYFRRAEIPAPAENELMPDVVAIHSDKDIFGNREQSFFISASIVSGRVRVVARADRSPELAVYRRASVAWEREE